MRAMSDSTQTPVAPGLYREGDERAPSAEKATTDMRIEITDKAAEKARTLLEQRGTPDACVRLGVKGGGCTGLAYVLIFEDRPPRATSDPRLAARRTAFVRPATGIRGKIGRTAFSGKGVRWPTG